MGVVKNVEVKNPPLGCPGSAPVMGRESEFHVPLHQPPQPATHELGVWLMEAVRIPPSQACKVVDAQASQNCTTNAECITLVLNEPYMAEKTCQRIKNNIIRHHPQIQSLSLALALTFCLRGASRRVALARLVQWSQQAGHPSLS